MDTRWVTAARRSNQLIFSIFVKNMHEYSYSTVFVITDDIPYEYWSFFVTQLTVMLSKQFSIPQALIWRAADYLVLSARLEPYLTQVLSHDNDLGLFTLQGWHQIFSTQEVDPSANCFHYTGSVARLYGEQPDLWRKLGANNMRKIRVVVLRSDQVLRIHDDDIIPPLRQVESKPVP
ncbi:unnamed protein product [Lactuca saligna]|uniref:Uncharacterized protein n=1 Tax=Lactuca saligna TaxID=75948 RepID=A0AA35YF18_LACSI|nr:unnamed protein product [Lactuca saligna]